MKPFLKIAIILLLINSFSAVAQVSGGSFTLGVPDAFGGVWERDDRYVMFAEDNRFLDSSVQAVLADKNATEVQKNAARNQIEYTSILLKTFYGWYLDRTAEPASFAAEKRILNDSTCPEAEHIRIEYRPIVHGEGAAQNDSSVWELFVHYPGVKEAAVIPVAIIGGNLYLNFAIKLNMPQEDAAAESLALGSAAPLERQNGGERSDGLVGFWCSLMPSDGVKVSLPNSGDNIYSTYITPDAVYTIRYWLTNMDYTSENAFFSDGGKTYSVVKHIQSGGKVFTCTNGRSVTIRNVQKSNKRPEVYELNSTATICGLGEPYLKRVQDENNVQAVVALVQKAMSTKAPNPDPPFPPSNLDFHMDEIYRLEEGNLIIQSLRERNKNWGVLQPPPAEN